MEKNNGTLLITLDGIRRKEIFNKNIALFLNNIISKPYCIKINNMVVANNYKISYPGFNDILTGKVNKKIKSNKKIKNNFKTFFEINNLKPTLALSWRRFEEIYNIKRSKLKIANLKKTKKNKNIKLNKTIKCPNDYKINKNNEKYIITNDCNTFDIFCKSWKKNKETKKCGHLGFVDADNVAHDKNFELYIEFIKYYDKCIEYIWKNLFPETLIITTDHGRGNKYWANHYNNLPGSNDVWCIIISKNKEKLKNVYSLLSKEPINTDIYKLMENFIL